MSNEPEAGPKLDAMIHDVVFGQRVYTQQEMREIAEEVWRRQPQCCVFIDGFTYTGNEDAIEGPLFAQTMPRYSADTAAAMKVLADLRLALLPLDGRWAAGRFTYSLFASNQEHYAVYVDDELGECGIADTIPLAICRAALKVKAAQNPAIEPVPSSAPAKAECGPFGFACGKVLGQ